ncbi:MAG: hypothetical protein WDA24_06285 [Tissierellales bacterium]
MGSQKSSNGKRKIYILLTNTGSIPTKIIKVYTKSPYNHVAISFTKDLRRFYSFGRKKYYNPLLGGFVVEGVDSKIYKYFDETTCSIFSLEVDWRIFRRMRRVIKEFEKEKDKYDYSFIGLLGVIANIPIEREYCYFCSQFVATVLEKSGLNLFNKPPGLVTPNDFLDLKELEHIYTGKLSEYSINADLRTYNDNFIPTTSEV